MDKPQKIGRYIVQRMLGEGAMGSVYMAVDPAIKRTVAIKTIKIDTTRSREEQDEFLQRFFQEAQISGNLNHPNIVNIYDIGDEGGVPYLALEYVEGKTLNQLVRESVRPGFQSLAKAIVQVANALTFAHRKGIVHRDLKPANIMITPEGDAKIMDFGIAKMSGSNLTQTGIFLGTPSYSSPEQVREGRVDHRSDIFSLGILAHEILTGYNPFPGQNISTILYKIANEAPESPPNLKDLPIHQESWQNVFSKVLEKDPEKRIQNASLFGQMLLQCINLSSAASVELSEFIEEGPTTIKQTIGVEKRIERSEFEKTLLPQPISPKKKKSYPGLWFAFSMILLFGLILTLDATKMLPEKARVSQFFPEKIRKRFFPPAEIQKLIYFNSTPTGAIVWLNDQQLAQTPTSHQIQGSPGSLWTVVVRKEGFEEFKQNFNLDDAKELPLNVTLKPLPLIATIQSKPPGADIQIDQKKSGKTPLEFSFSKGITYTITYQLQGYEEETVAFDPNVDQPPKLTVEMRKIAPPGTLEIISEVPDLSITINGRKRNNTIELPSGRYQVVLSSPKVFYSETRTISLKSGERQELFTPPVVVILKIDSRSPANYARVEIDGRDVDDTPIANLKITKGRHSFKFYDESGKLLYQEEKEVVDGSKVIVPL